MIALIFGTIFIITAGVVAAQQTDADKPKNTKADEVAAKADEKSFIDKDDLQQCQESMNAALKKIQEFQQSYSQFKTEENIKNQFDDLLSGIKEMTMVLSEESPFMRNLNAFKIECEGYAEKDRRDAEKEVSPTRKTELEKLAEENEDRAKRVGKRIEEARQMRDQFTQITIEMRNIERDMVRRLRNRQLAKMEDKIHKTFGYIKKAIDKLDTLLAENNSAINL